MAPDGTSWKLTHLIDVLSSVRPMGSNCGMKIIRNNEFVRTRGTGRDERWLLATEASGGNPENKVRAAPQASTRYYRWIGAL